MFATGLNQLGFAASMLSGRRFRIKDVYALVHETRATIEEFGEPGEAATDMLNEQDPELQRDLTERRLRRTVRAAARETPYYRRWFETNRVDLDTLTPETLRAIAPTPKKALRAAPTAFVADNAQPAMAMHTTGTTGVPTQVWFSHYELELLSGIGALALMLRDRVRSNHVIANCVTSRSLAPYLQARSVPLTGAAYLPMGIIEPAISLDRLAAPVHLPGKEPRITHLTTPPSFLAALLQEAERGGWKATDFGLRQILCGGEILTEALRQRAEEVFGAPVADGYAMTETVPVMGSVCGHRHLHIPHDQGVVEILDPDTYEPALPGSVGVLTVTPFSLFRDTTLLLRYVTGDLVRVLPAEEKLECEMAGVPAMSQILGRMAGPALATRDVLELLQAERALPLPTRYALEETPAGPRLHVLADRISRPLLARLEERAADLELPIAGIVLVDDPADLPAPCLVRADLREHSFERVASPAVGVS